MSKRICLAVIVLLASAAPVWADTPSKTCLAAINSAAARHKADKVPPDCWRMGPLRLGMTKAQLRTLLGKPDASQTLTPAYRRRKYPLTQLLYVYPRNLQNWLRLAPARQTDFHPVTLRLSFFKDVLVAINVGHTARTVPPACKPAIAGNVFVHRGGDFPYGFHGLTLGATVSSVQARFGRFSGTNATHDFGNYWPVPFSVTGEGKVSDLQFASGMAFAAADDIPDFHLTLDPRSCFVRGYTLSAAPPGH